MKDTAIESPIYPIYDLANPHFGEVQIVTHQNESLKGQFVRFKVVNEKFVTIHPSEKYCFLPAEHRIEFWKTFNANKGEFKTVPAYIKKYGLNEIRSILITPAIIL